MKEHSVFSLLLCCFLSQHAVSASEESSLSGEIDDLIGCMHCPPPAFLQKLSSESKKELMYMLRDGNLTKKSLLEKLQQWKQKQPAEIQQEYNHFYKHFEQQGDEAIANATKTMNVLPKIFENGLKILIDNDTPRKEVLKQIFRGRLVLH